MKRNLYSLRNFTDLTKPDFIFLSEPQIFTSDLPHCMSHFGDEYCSELNSEDKFDIEIAMNKRKATGGTMVLWKKCLDKYVTIHPVHSTSFLPLVFSPPDSPVSVHIALYLPTSGKEAEFVDQITQLSNCLDDLRELYEDCLIFIRGDGNVNTNNLDRTKVFSTFLSFHNLEQVFIDHKTYHHFLGGGAFDSNFDPNQLELG